MTLPKGHWSLNLNLGSYKNTRTFGQSSLLKDIGLLVRVTEDFAISELDFIKALDLPHSRSHT